MLGMSQKRPRSPFGLPGPISGFGGGTFDLDGTQVTPTLRMADEGAAAPSPKPKGGLFARGGVGRAIAGSIGDALLQYNGMRPIYAPAMEAQHNGAMKEAKRAAEYEDFVRREQWKRDNPAPRVNDTEADYAFWQSKLTPEEFATWKKNRVSPPVWRQGEDGRFYQMETAPAGGDAPDTLPADFFSQGGATPGGSPTFREAFAGY